MEGCCNYIFILTLVSLKQSLIAYKFLIHEQQRYIAIVLIAQICWSVLISGHSCKSALLCGNI